jgi:putative ABC transport system permease protein
VVGVQPAQGRGFDTNDGAETASVTFDNADSFVPAVVIGHELWRRSFGGDSAVIGRVVTLSARPVRLVGVMPPGFRFPADTNVWTPAPPGTAVPNYGRLTSGTSVAQVRAEFPALRLDSLRDATRPTDATGVTFLLALSVLLVVLAWIQAAGLLFVRTAERSRDIGIRIALGAGRGDLHKAAATDGLLLAGLSLALASLAVGPIVAVIAAQLPTSLTAGQYLEPDVRTFAFSAVLSAFGVLVFSVAPTALLSRLSISTLLRATLTPQTLRGVNARRVVLLGQVVITGCLLYLAGLVTHSFVRSMITDYGFQSDRLLVFRAPTAFTGRDQEELKRAFGDVQARIRRTADVVRSVPGVEYTATLDHAPFFGRTTSSRGLMSGEVEVENEVVEFNGRPIRPLPTVVRGTSQDFAEALGARVLAGESFSAPEYRGQRGIAVVNETLARLLSPVGSPVGRTIRTSFFQGRIVGVITDMIDRSPGLMPTPQLFHPSDTAAVVMIRTSGPIADALPAIRRAMQDVWGDLPPGRVAPIAEDMDEVLAPWRGRTVLAAILGSLSLPLAVVGLAGGLMFAIRSRNREFALRLALGASSRDIQRLMLGEVTLTVAAGLAAGLLCGVLAGMAGRSLLFEVGPVDLWSIGAVACSGVCIVVVASAWPLRQISRVRPATALKN